MIHIFWKLGKEASIEPPIHTENLRSGWAAIFISLLEGTNFTPGFDNTFIAPGAWIYLSFDLLHAMWQLAVELIAEP